jgi:hypothetical protein
MRIPWGSGWEEEVLKLLPAQYPGLTALDFNVWNYVT